MFSAIMSFQAESRGPEHTAVTMPEVLEPESPPKVSDYLGELPHPIAQAVAWERPIDMRHVDAPRTLQPDSSSTEPRACVWFKTFDRLVHADGSEASDAEHRAAIAYASGPPAPGVRPAPSRQVLAGTGAEECLTGSRDVVPPPGPRR